MNRKSKKYSQKPLGFCRNLYMWLQVCKYVSVCGCVYAYACVGYSCVLLCVCVGVSEGTKAARCFNLI